MHIDPTLSKQGDNNKASHVRLGMRDGDLQRHNITGQGARFQQLGASSDNLSRHGSTSASSLGASHAHARGQGRMIHDLEALGTSRDSTCRTRVAWRRTG